MRTTAVVGVFDDPGKLSGNPTECSTARRWRPAGRRQTAEPAVEVRPPPRKATPVAATNSDTNQGGCHLPHGIGQVRVGESLVFELDTNLVRASGRPNDRATDQWRWSLPRGRWVAPVEILTPPCRYEAAACVLEAGRGFVTPQWGTRHARPPPAFRSRREDTSPSSSAISASVMARCRTTIRQELVDVHLVGVGHLHDLGRVAAVELWVDDVEP